MNNGTGNNNIANIINIHRKYLILYLLLKLIGFVIFVINDCSEFAINAVVMIADACSILLQELSINCEDVAISLCVEVDGLSI